MHGTSCNSRHLDTDSKHLSFVFVRSRKYGARKVSWRFDRWEFLGVGRDDVGFLLVQRDYESRWTPTDMDFEESATTKAEIRNSARMTSVGCL